MKSNCLGKILWVDLTKGRTNTERITEQMTRSYIGGRGLAMRILWDHVPPGTNPLGPANLILFSTGPLTGTPLGLGRTTVTTKSPETGLFVEGNIGGFFGPELKFAGFDIVVLRGTSPKPVYLWIDDDHVELRDAAHVWGKDTVTTERMIKEELGDEDIQFRVIGPAGEKLVNTSTVLGNLNRAGGRSAAAVMGSKKLKAVAVRGTGGIRVADPTRFEEALRDVWNALDLETCVDPFAKIWGLYGSSCIIRYLNEIGGVGARNYQDATLEGNENFSGDQTARKYITRPRACFCCPFPGCSKQIEIKSGPYAGLTMEGIQAPGAHGSSCGVTDFEAIVKASKVANELGVGFISAGMTIAWAMEAYEKGILTDEEVDGIDLRFGNAEAVIQLMQKIGKREGFGDLLADGVKAASERIGRGSGDFAMHVKGMDFTTIEPRAFFNMALAYAVNDMGADHTRVYPPYPPTLAALDEYTLNRLPFDPASAGARQDPAGKGPLVKWLLDSRAVVNSLEFCVFTSRGRIFADLRPFAKALSAAVGFEMSDDQLMTAGERICNLERGFNVREGASRKDDTLPRRFLEEPLQNGGSQGHVVPLEEMLDDYYEARGWDVETGIPTRDKLEELGLDDVADWLEESQTDWRKLWLESRSSTWRT